MSKKRGLACAASGCLEALLRQFEESVPVPAFCGLWVTHLNITAL